MDTQELTRFMSVLREMKGCVIAETFEDRIAALEAAAANIAHATRVIPVDVRASHTIHVAASETASALHSWGAAP